jgi:hypothetical protein
MFTVEYAHSPFYTVADHSHITLKVKFAEFEEEHPFGAMPTDSMPHGVDIYNRAVAGEFGIVAPYVAPQPRPE